MFRRILTLLLKMVISCFSAARRASTISLETSIDCQYVDGYVEILVDLRPEPPATATFTIFKFQWNGCLDSGMFCRCIDSLKVKWTSGVYISTLEYLVILVNSSILDRKEVALVVPKREGAWWVQCLLPPRRSSFFLPPSSIHHHIT